MNKQVKIAIIVVGFAAAVGLFMYNMRAPDLPSPPAGGERTAAPRERGGAAPAGGRGARTAAPGAGPVDTDALIESVQDVDFDYSLQLAATSPRDPMAPLITPIGGFGQTGKREGEGGGEGSGEAPITPTRISMLIRSMPVTSIVYSETSPVAVVNGQVVKPGYVFQELGGVMVQRITPDSVTLVYENQPYELKLVKER